MWRFNLRERSRFMGMFYSCVGGLCAMTASSALAQDIAPPAPAQHAPAEELPFGDSCEAMYKANAERLKTEYERLYEECCPEEEAAVCECPAPCEDSWCDLGDPFSLSDSLFGEDSWLKVGGWTQWGYHSESNGMFNNHDSQFGNHQSWLYAERVADGSDGFDWGFRADLMYGLDAQDTQAFGEPAPVDHWDNEWDQGNYGWALPQLYVEVAYKDLSIKAGHFFTLIGYEVVTAPDNFFYSHAYTMYNSEPFTHSGALATYNVNDEITVYGGWTAGWDTGFDRYSDVDTTPGGVNVTDQSKGSNFLGGISVAVTENLSVTYITTIGDFGIRGEGYAHSVVADLTFLENFNYVFQTDLVETNLKAGPNHQYSLNNYLFYTVNDCLKFGTRMEMWKNGGESQYEWTLGLNYKPTANLVIRPEIRHDWLPAGRQFNITAPPGKDNFTTFGVDAILTF